MSCDFPHLNAETKAIVNEDLCTRELWNNRPHFVFFDKIPKLLQKLNWIFQQTAMMQSLDPQDLYDIESLTIVGRTGAGKSTLCRYFQGLHSRHQVEEREIIPVVHVKLKSQIAGLTGFYTALLEPYGSPYSNPEYTENIKPLRIAQFHELLKAYIRTAETKIIFIDEFQHIFETKQKRHVYNQTIVNHLKLLMEEARVAIIPVGVLSVEAFLASDSQLAGRCPIKEYSRLDYLDFPNLDEGIDAKKEMINLKRECPMMPPAELRTRVEGIVQEKQRENQEARARFRNLLKGFEAYLPFPEPSRLSSPEISELIFQRVKFSKIEEGELGRTNIRKIAWFLRIVGDLALKNGHTQVHIEDIRNTEI